MAPTPYNTLDSESEVHYHPYRTTRTTRSTSQSESTQSASQDDRQSLRVTRSQSRSTTQFFSLPTLKQSVKEKRIYISAMSVATAREGLLEFQKDHIEGEEEKEEKKEGYTGSREITLQENVSLDSYLRYIENNDKINKVNMVRMYLRDGSIKAYEVPSAPHAYTSGKIKLLMGAWNNQDFDYGNNGDLILGQTSSRRPHCLIFPINRPPPTNPAQAADLTGGPYPTMVAEVGYSQSLSDLHQAAISYFNPRTTIQIVLIVKIFGVRRDPNTNIGTIALITALFLRTSPNPLIPTRVVSFGTADPDQNTMNYILINMGVPVANFIGVGLPNPNNNNNPFPPCNATGIPIYTMNIPGIELFDGVPANSLPPNFNLGCDIDLWELQCTVRRHLGI